MRESKFVEQNKEKWSQFEKDLNSNNKDPQMLRAHLVQITDDLSYSRTFYRNRSVRIYLNGLGQQIYNNIYRNKKNFIHSLARFFSDEIPRIMYFCRKEILISFLVLCLSVAIGAFSAARDEGFSRSILGDSYVDMTLQNIKKGDPLGVYKNEGQVEMFFSIVTNNLNVALIVFISGLLASYGALVIMARNGIMLGVFMYFFYSRNLANDFNLTVWMHGTTEILSLVIETVAGMLLGRGLVYPGTLSRSKAFSIWGKRGAMVFLSAVPFIIFAAFIESFLTRYTEMPNLLRVILILGSLVLMVFYFIAFPWSKFRHEKDIDLGMPELRPETGINFNPDTIYSNGQIFLKSVQLFRLNFHQILSASFLIGVIYVGILAIINSYAIIGSFKLLEIDFGELLWRVLSKDLGKFFELYGNMGLLFNRGGTLSMYLLSSVWIAILAYYAMHIFFKNLPNPAFNKGKAMLFSLVFSLSANAMLLSNNSIFTLLYIALSPVLLTLLIGMSFGNGIKEIIFQFSRMLGGNLGRTNGILFLFLMGLFMGMVFIISPFSYLAVWLMEMNIELSEKSYTMVLQTIMMIAFAVLMSFSFLFYITQCIFLYFTLKEINEAKGLMDGIEKIGKSKKVYGIETE